MLADRFMKMEPVTGWPFGTSGNNRVKTGLSQRANTFTIPPLSPIFITPNHNESTPVNPKEISKAVLDWANVASIMAGNTSRSPMNNSFAKATTKATKKNATQI